MSTSSQPTNQSSVQPLPQERYSAFVARAHQHLLPLIPDPDERNQVVWDSWARINGDSHGDRARRLFPPDKYRNVSNVCYFYEHSTTGRDGAPVRYSVKELGDIVDEHNDRADTNSFSALTNGHTVDGIVPDHMQPKVLGYVGPYRLGMVGYDKPKFAVFADEHHEIEATQVLNRKKRRSVEVNRFRDGRRPYFDPIAALGAESPRLALPIAQYSAQDAFVERYQIMAPAMVSGSNTFIPSDDPLKERHESQTQPEQSAMDDGQQGDTGGGSSAGGDMVSMIVKAIQSTPEMEWVRQQMQQGAAQSQQQPGVPGAQGGISATGSQDAANQQPSQQYGFNPMGANQFNPNSQYSSQDAEVDRYSQLQEEFRLFQDRYAMQEEARKEDLQTIATLRRAVANLESVKVDSDRRERIRTLADQYQIDTDKEFSRCLYCEGAEMSDEQFESHVQLITDYAPQKRDPYIPQGKLGASASGKEKYSEDFVRRVVDRATEEGKSFDEMARILEAEGA